LELDIAVLPTYIALSTPNHEVTIMQTALAFIESVVRIAKQQGYRIEINRDGRQQIDFGHKKLHEGHLEAIFPAVLAPNADITSLIKTVAPGRPCAHRPMKKIIAQLRCDLKRDSDK